MRVGMFSIQDFGKAINANLQTSQCFLNRFLKGAANGHHLTDGFHLRGQARVSLWKLFEIKARYFGDHVIDAWLKRRWGTPAGDFIAQLVEGITDRQFGGDLSDREAGGLGRQR